MSESALMPRDRGVFVGLSLLLALIWLSTLSVRPLFNPDEGRYAEIPREMLSGGDWVIPHLNGLAYVEKPPLQYWATAICYSLLGVNEFSARLYCALTALFTLALVGFAAGRLWDPAAGRRAAAVLSGMLLFVVLGQLLTLDMSLTFYLTVSLTGFLLAQRASRPLPWMLLAWAAAGLGVLTKGLVAAAIPAAVLILYSLYARDFSPWRRLCARWGLPLFLAITVPWHWLAARRLEDFLQFFFVHEHLSRYLTPVSNRQEPWWFFIAVLLAGTLPWTASIVRVMARGWRRASHGDFNPTLFLWLWVVFVVVFFSLSDSKLMPYVLPAMPALALLIAALPAVTLQKDFLFTAVATVLAGLALGLASYHWAWVISSSDRMVYFLPLAKPLGQIAALLAASGAFVLVQRRREATRDAVFLGCGWCLAWLLVVRSAALLAPVYSGAGLAAALPKGEDAPLYSVGTYDQTLEFYLRRTVTPVAYRGELDYGLRHSPDAEIASVPEFVALWAVQPKGFALMGNAVFDNLQGAGVPMRVISRNAGNVLVARQ